MMNNSHSRFPLWGQTKWEGDKSRYGSDDCNFCKIFCEYTKRCRPVQPMLVRYAVIPVKLIISFFKVSITIVSVTLWMCLNITLGFLMDLYGPWQYGDKKKENFELYSATYRMKWSSLRINILLSKRRS